MYGVTDKHESIDDEMIRAVRTVGSHSAQGTSHVVPFARGQRGWSHCRAGCRVATHASVETERERERGREGETERGREKKYEIKLSKKNKVHVHEQWYVLYNSREEER